MAQGGSCVFMCADMCDCPLPQHPLTFTHGGGKPYPYVLTLKGKPLGRNPNRVNPTVIPYSTVRLYRSVHSYSSRNPQCKGYAFFAQFVSCVQVVSDCRCLKGFSMCFQVQVYQYPFPCSIPCIALPYPYYIPYDIRTTWLRLSLSFLFQLQLHNQTSISVCPYAFLCCHTLLS